VGCAIRQCNGAELCEVPTQQKLLRIKKHVDFLSNIFHYTFAVVDESLILGVVLVESARFVALNLWAMAPIPSAHAQRSISDAFEKLERAVTTDDAREFHSTTLRDVRDAAKDIETELRARGMVRNMARLEPFFAGLDRYSKVVEILCNGTPYLPWIWV
jgi:hypothetical protein